MTDEQATTIADRAPAPRDLRQHPRHAVQLSAHLETAGRSYTCSVVDLSLGGARLRVGCPLSGGQLLYLVIDGLGTLPAQVVWQGEPDGIRTAGVRFSDLVPELRSALAEELSRRTGTA